MEPVIIYEDSDLVCVSKPSGMLIHPTNKNESLTLADWIKDKYPEMNGVGEPAILSNGEKVSRPGIVHRLDKETSGVVCLAKNEKSYLNLKQQFQNRKVEKIYNAFLYGVPEIKKDTINVHIGRAKGAPTKRATGDMSRGKQRESITDYEVLNFWDNKYSFVEARPKTGRTHQLRVHFKHIGNPIVCDKLYAPKKSCVLGFSRLALHARSISITDMKGARIIVETDLPDDFKKALINANNL